MNLRMALLTLALATASSMAVGQAPAGSAGAPLSAMQPPQSIPNGFPTTPVPPLGNQNDSALQSQIENALGNEPALSSSHITVNVTAESIDLTGTLGSSKDKQAAERIAQSFDGNRKLNDNLTLTGHGRSDPAADHSALNNSGTGNTQNPANNATNNRASTRPQK